MVLKELKLGFIGPGKMAYSIVNGIISSDFIHPQNVYIYGLESDNVAHFVDLGCKTYIDSSVLFSECDIIFFCVKPQNLLDLSKVIESKVSNNILYVSIMAGVTTSKIRDLFSDDLKIIRTMPNMSLMLGEGATAISYTENVSENDLKLVKDIFSLIGKVAVIPEEQMNSIICVNGSTPALIFLLSKLVREYAVSNGIDDDVAKLLFSQTLIGSAKMILETEMSDDELISAIAAKGGTTQAALDSLDSNNFSEIFKEGLNACLRRADELAKL